MNPLAKILMKMNKVCLDEMKLIYKKDGNVLEEVPYRSVEVTIDDLIDDIRDGTLRVDKDLFEMCDDCTLSFIYDDTLVEINFYDERTNMCFNLTDEVVINSIIEKCDLCIPYHKYCKDLPVIFDDWFKIYKKAKR